MPSPRSDLLLGAAALLLACSPVMTRPPAATSSSSSSSAASSASAASASASASSEAPAIVQVGLPVLRARAAEVPAERIGTPEFQALVDRMIDVMRKAPGVGLAAPQIGEGLRVLVLEDRGELLQKLNPEELRERERVAVPVHVVINPVLRLVGAERRTFFEGCLSLRGYSALVERSAEVEVTGLDRRGQPQTLRWRGWPARILQHEVDHLDGTLYIDRMLPRSFSTNEQARALYGGLPIAEVRRRLGL